MNKTKIDWCDSTWNPVTGCFHSCEYCYARRIAKRFGGASETHCNETVGTECQWETSAEGKIHVLGEPIYDYDYGRNAPYPYEFDPTFHKYRLNEYQNKKYCEYVAHDIDTTGLEACCDDSEPYYEHVAAEMEVEHEERWFSSSEWCRVKFWCDADENLNKELRLYRNKTDRNWNISYEINTFCDINSLRNLSQFDIFLMTLKRGFVDIEIDTESEYEDDIEPEETPEWSLD